MALLVTKQIQRMLTFQWEWEAGQKQENQGTQRRAKQYPKSEGREEGLLAAKETRLTGFLQPAPATGCSPWVWTARANIGNVQNFEQFFWSPLFVIECNSRQHSPGKSMIWGISYTWVCIRTLLFTNYFELQFHL